MDWVYNDGGRKQAGWTGTAGDCGCRAVAIATGRPYNEIYEAINVEAKRERPRGRRQRSTARNGTWPKTLGRVLAQYGWRWTPTMKVGQGCKVHLRASELPSGPLVVRVSKHYVAVLDGVIHDTHNPARDGSRCVYGYWSKP